MRQINLEPIIQSEISQKETNKYHILTPIYRLQKDGTNEPICRAAMEMQTQRTGLWDMVGGEKGEGEMYGESNIEIYNAICKTDSQWEFAV